MNLLQFLLILKARYKVIVITFLITVITAVVVTALLPQSFKATTSLLLNYKGLDPVTGVVLPSQLMPGYMATQVDIIHSKNIALKVIDDLGLTESDSAQKHFHIEATAQNDSRDRLAGLLLKELEVKPSRESSVIEITFNAEDPAFASAVANSFAEKYMETSVQLKVDPALKAADYFSKRIQVLRQNLQQAQMKLSNYERENGVTNPEQSYDVESMRLNELSSQLSLAQAASIEAQSRARSAQSSAANSPDVALNPVLQTLRVDVSKAEAKLAELSQRLGKNHPQYQSAEAELNKIKNLFNQELQRSSQRVSGTANINAQREAELRLEVEEQKKRLLDLNMARGQLSVLQKDVETAQNAIDAVTQRFGQTNIEGHSDQSDIVLLNPATPPLAPSGPRMILAILLAIVMGGVLGIGFGLIAELIDRRIRCSEDISELLAVPVFAMIKSKPTKLNAATTYKPQKFLGST